MTPSTTIRVYNTLSKDKQPFVPVTPGKVGIYLCGPTVYKECHIGHAVGPVIFDTIVRYLKYSGYDVTWVVNITDVDDKLIAQSRERGVPMAQIAEEMTLDYLNNMAGLGVTQITHMPRATEHMAGIIAFIEKLIAKDHAYESGGDVFFDVAKDPSYGKLSNRSAADQQGEGGGAASKKRNAGDFALWKSAKPGEPSWDSPWGKGRPGWHIECSAMSKAILGETFDMHGGGLDLLFPHHENEIAQSECCHDKPMVKYWLHNGLMRKAEAGKVGGRSDREGEQATTDTKIARSKGAGGLADLIAQYGGERLRFLLLRTHYRSTCVFGDEALAEAGTALESFYRFFERFQKNSRQRFFYLLPAANREAGNFDPGSDPLLKELHALRTSFLEKMDDDFNTGGAIADLFGMLTALNKFADEHKLDRFADDKVEAAEVHHDPQMIVWVRGAQVLRELSNILGLFHTLQPKRGGGDAIVPKLVELLIALRKEAREKKDYATGDSIRSRLGEIGVLLEDKKGVTEWRLGST
jgi:cysteinyl-tRNA synthetase